MTGEKHCEKSGANNTPISYPKRFSYKPPNPNESDRNSDEEWLKDFADPKNGWPKGYVEDERKAIEEFGGG